MPSQVTRVVVVMVAGVMVTLEMVGSRLPIVAPAESLSELPYPSVATARQMTESPGCQLAVFSVMVGPVAIPEVVPERFRLHW